jgi:hypothetical protein
MCSILLVLHQNVKYHLNQQQKWPLVCYDNNDAKGTNSILTINISDIHFQNLDVQNFQHWNPIVGICSDVYQVSISIKLWFHQRSLIQAPESVFRLS